MKLAISAAARRQLKECRLDLRATLSAHQDVLDRIEEIESAETSLESDLRNLRSSNAPDGDAFREIDEQEKQLNLLGREQSALRTKKLPAAEAAVLDEGRFASRDLQQALLPCLESALNEITNAFLPFFLNEPTARRRAADADLYTLLHRKIHFLANGPVSVENVRELLRWIEATLAADHSWVWPAAE